MPLKKMIFSLSSKKQLEQRMIVLRIKGKNKYFLNNKLNSSFKKMNNQDM